MQKHIKTVQLQKNYFEIKTAHHQNEMNILSLFRLFLSLFFNVRINRKTSEERF